MRPRVLINRAAPLLLLLGPACGGSTEPTSGVVRVAISQTGAGQDPDGVRIDVDGRESRTMQAGSIEFVLDPGAHTVRVIGVAPNCTLDGESTRTVTVAAAGTASVEFALSCSEAFGAIEVTSRTTGLALELDPSGYTVLVDEEPRLQIDANNTVVFTLPAGHHVVAIADVAINCAAGSETQAVDLGPGATIKVAFTVSCIEAPPAGRGHEIAFVRNRNLSGEEGLFGGGAPELYIMNEDGTHAHKPPAADSLIGERYPAWAPDGSRLAFLGMTVGQELHIYSYDLATDDRRQLTANECRVGQPTWSPDGARIACQNTYEVFDSTLSSTTVMDLLTFNADGSDAHVLVSATEVESPERVTWSPDGSRLVYALGGTFFDEASDRLGRNGDLFVVNADGSDPHPITATPEPELEPAWSPDGTRLAFASAASPFVPLEIYVMNADGSDRVQLTHGGVNTSPAWSPDGSRIAFVSRRDGNAEIYVMNADGSHQERITNNPTFDGDPSWRP